MLLNAKVWFGLLAVTLLSSFGFQQNRNLNRYTISGYAQGTSYNISYYAEADQVTKRSIDSIMAVIDSSMSLYKPYSTINAFNEANREVLIDDHFKKVIEKALEIHTQTEGVFDVTVGPLVEAWGFGPKVMTNSPDSSLITQLKRCTGSDLLKLDGNMLLKSKPCVKIDLNGIAQGYTVDVVADFLLSKGINYFVVEVGGELRVNGPKPDGSAMRIGIEGPKDGHSEPVIVHIAAINSGAITTSGNYRKFIEDGGSRRSHLIDPYTGFPIANSLISVTLYAKDAITADGYDNALMGMGLERALNFVEEQDGMDAYFIYQDDTGSYQDTITTGFQRLLVKE